MKVIFDDDREIESIHDDSAGITWCIVGVNDITKIEVYKEHGEYGYVPYFAIWKGDFLYQRRPALGLRVDYKH